MDGQEDDAPSQAHPSTRMPPKARTAEAPSSSRRTGLPWIGKLLILPLLATREDSPRERHLLARTGTGLEEIGNTAATVLQRGTGATPVRGGRAALSSVRPHRHTVFIDPQNFYRNAASIHFFLASIGIGVIGVTVCKSPTAPWSFCREPALANAA